MNYECRKYHGMFIFWTPVISDYGKTTQISWLLTEERGRPEYTVCIWRNRYGNHLIWWNVYISRRFLNNFMIINLELGHSVFNKHPLNNSTFVSRKRVVKFCFDLIPWTLLSLQCVQIFDDCSKGSCFSDASGSVLDPKKELLLLSKVWYRKNIWTVCTSLIQVWFVKSPSIALQVFRLKINYNNYQQI